jgi:hypothetical protein
MPQQGTILPPVEDGPWAKGTDSFLEATQVQKGFYRWSVNVSNRGGIVRTRSGLSVIPVLFGGAYRYGVPRGMTVFTDKNDNTYLVIAIDTVIMYLKYPFKNPDGTFANWSWLSQLSFVGTGPVTFTRCIQSVTEDAAGNLTDIDPVPMLIIQDGTSRAGFWDGTNARHLNPAKKNPFNGPSETPIGLWAAWSGNRYWVSNGSRVRASNLLNPLKFTEEDLLEEGGFLSFSGIVTGMANTANFQNLLVYTDNNTSTLMSSLFDRTQWAQTQGFQSVTFPGIGCVGGFAIGTQWGIKWWFSHDGLMSFDEGARTYQVSKISYRDREMAWSKSNIAPALKKNIALGSFENLLMISAPSGDIYNAHTWVMDEAPLDVLTYWGYFGLPAWSGIWEGIRPVQWVTEVVKGVNRTFCISKDYNGQNNVWEAVTGTRIDNSVDTSLNPVQKEITCSLETKLVGYDGNYKWFRLAEIYLDNVEGEVDLTASYAPRRGGYKQVLKKHIVSSDWILQNPNTQIAVDTFIFDPQKPQSRVVRTISEAKSYTGPNTGDDAFQGVQTSANVPFPHQKDYGFSLLLQWTGRMSIADVRFYFDAEEQEIEGIAEVDEETDRFVDMFGINKIAPPPKTPYIVDPLAMDFQSNVITGTAPLWIDMNLSTYTAPLYQST